MGYPTDASADPLRLINRELAVTVTPAKGADITSIREVSRDVELLFQTPWRRATEQPSSLGLDSKGTWLQRYAGGWQLLCPNAGEEHSRHGVTWGYHGEASLASWRIENADDSSCSLSTELFTAPLRLERTIELRDSRLSLRERVANLSGETIEYSLVEHPAFGAPLIGPACELTCGAHTIVTDAEAPGTVLTAESLSQWPWAEGTRARIDLSAFPPREEPRSVFACLTDFESPFFAFSNRDLGLGVGLRWDARVFPHAWYWQELNASSGFPWYRRAYVAAVEPANQLPGVGSIGSYRRGPAATLAPYADISTEIVLVVFSPTGKVADVTASGTVVFDT